MLPSQSPLLLPLVGCLPLRLMVWAWAANKKASHVAILCLVAVTCLWGWGGGTRNACQTSFRVDVNVALGKSQSRREVVGVGVLGPQTSAIRLGCCGDHLEARFGNNAEVHRGPATLLNSCEQRCGQKHDRSLVHQLRLLVISSPLPPRVLQAASY